MINGEAISVLLNASILQKHKQKLYTDSTQNMTPNCLSTIKLKLTIKMTTHNQKNFSRKMRKLNCGEDYHVYKMKKSEDQAEFVSFMEISQNTIIDRRQLINDNKKLSVSNWLLSWQMIQTNWLLSWQMIQMQDKNRLIEKGTGLCRNRRWDRRFLNHGSTNQGVRNSNWWEDKNRVSEIRHFEFLKWL